jgi:hypothetical protein
MTLDEAKYLAQDDETLGEYLKDIIYKGTKATTRYKVENIPNGQFETVDGRRFDSNDEALAHENALVDAAVENTTAKELLLSLAGTHPQVCSMVRGTVARSLTKESECELIQSN